MENELLQSRRAFFKNAAKSSLPVISAVIMAHVPSVGIASTGCEQCRDVCTGCQFGCGGDNCGNHCKAACRVGCEYQCDRGCEKGNNK